ncbi:MAG: aspartyl protease family protein [Verrucomicrobiota bacterium]
MRLVVWVVFLVAARVLYAEPVASSSATRELPIKFREGLLWLEVRVPRTDKALNFLVDSGASVSVVNLSTARRLGLDLGRKVSVGGVGASLTGYWPVRLVASANKVELPGEFLALDLNKFSRACSNSVDGLIGADFFRDRVVQIDYAAQRLRILDATHRFSDAGTNSIPLEIRPCGFRVAVRVNGGRSQRVRVDTGCATAFQWVTSKESADQCTNKRAVGLAELSIPQTMTGVRIGNHYLDTVPTGLHRKAIFPGESGLLGNGLLASFGVITIDAKSGRLILGRLSAE